MAYDPDAYDIEAAYAQDPVGVTNAVIAEAAAIGAAEVAQIHDTHRDADYTRLHKSQVESAAITAMNELEAKYGRDEYKRLMPAVQQRMVDNPHLVPQEVWESPIRLARSLDDVFKLAKGEAAEKDRRDHWQGVMDSNTSMPRFG